jgi:hypothetical protein
MRGWSTYLFVGGVFTMLAAASWYALALVVRPFG